jgi:predicted alpha-1,2-mannosidase
MKKSQKIKEKKIGSRILSIFLTLISILIMFNSCSEDDQITSKTNYTRFVNPFIGTSGTGHTYPGATLPFGFVQLSPQTGNGSWEYVSGYQYTDTLVEGFAHTHLSGGGIADLGDVLMLPYNDERTIKNFAVHFSKKEEKASPGYYSSLLTNDHIRVELTTTERTGFHRYTFQKGGDSHVLISISDILFSWGDTQKSRVKEAEFKIKSNTGISGYLHSDFKVERKVYFTIQLNTPFADCHFLEGTSQRKLVVDYVLDPGEQIEARVGISTVSIDGAKKNLQAESMGYTFDEIRANAASLWNKYLSKITIEGTREQKENFYTSMYHLFIQPNNIADVDGRYRGSDLETIYSSPCGAYYSTFAFWDVYRAAFPLYTILIPGKTGEFICSLLEYADKNGHLPRWSLWGRDCHTMIGNHGVPVVVDAYLKGITGIDGEKVFTAVKNTLTKDIWRKYNWVLYDKYGYLPSDLVRSEAVSRTLEATYDDWCAARLAKELGKTKEYDFFSKRAQYYKNVFDTTTLLMRGRNSDGSWVKPFDPILIDNRAGYTEANAWQYTWHVQHDVEGLIQLMGGKETFAARLDTLFSMDSRIYGGGLVKDVTGLIGQYAHGNEPSQHIIYLYNYAGKLHKTQELIPKVLRSQHTNAPDGLCGNDDFGQMSAWYILSSLGFYPVNPVSGVFDIGVPSYKKASVKLENGKIFTINANNLTAENIYVRSAKLNGNPLNIWHISYNNIVNGGILEFEMTDKPVKK